MEIAAASIIALVFSVYIVLISIVLGASLIRLFSSVTEHHPSINDFMHPQWELVHGVMLFGVLCYIMFFPGTLSGIRENLTIPFVIAGIFYLLRFAGDILLSKDKESHRFLGTFACAGSLLAPIVVSGTAVYFLTGSYNAISPLAISIYTFSFTGILLIASAFFIYHFKSHARSLLLLNEASFSLFLVSVVLLFISAAVEAEYMFSNMYYNMGVYIGTMGLVVIAMYLQKKGTRYQNFLASAALVIGLFLTLFILHTPYLIYPNVTVYSGFTDTDSFWVPAAVFLAGSILVISGVSYVYRVLFAHESLKY